MCCLLSHFCKHYAWQDEISLIVRCSKLTGPEFYVLLENQELGGWKRNLDWLCNNFYIMVTFSNTSFLV